MVEILVVIAILGILISIMVPSLSKGKQLAEAMKNTYNLKQIAIATLTWAGDNGNKLPSPEYPGGMEVPGSMDPDDFFPKYWNLSEQANREENDGEYADSGGYSVDEQGSHIKGTLLENTQSVKKDVEERDYHKHSYAMNTNLQYDRIYESANSGDPYLTEKTLSNLLFMPNAMLYIENKESNLVDFEDRDSIIETMEERWDGSKTIAAYLDGHAERLREESIPEEDPEVDRLSSRFWRGVDP